MVRAKVTIRRSRDRVVDGCLRSTVPMTVSTASRTTPRSSPPRSNASCPSSPSRARRRRGRGRGGARASDQTQFIARDDIGTIVGVATLVVFRTPTGLRAWIEDVIVDEAAGGQGLGTLLTEAMLDRARQLGCKTVDLTSRPSREAANHLYRKVGFELRDTNVWRFTSTVDVIYVARAPRSFPGRCVGRPRWGGRCRGGAAAR